MIKNKQLKIIKGRNFGKTTYLYNEIVKKIAKNTKIFVLDSATDHKDKSLIWKLKSFQKKDFISFTDPNIIIDPSPHNLKSYISLLKSNVIYKSLLTNKEKLLLIDISYFLEKGFDYKEKFNDESNYTLYRTMYNNLSLQIFLSCLLLQDCCEIEIYLDEIEFPKKRLFVKHLINKINILASVHKENSFGGVYKYLKKLNKVKTWNK